MVFSVRVTEREYDLISKTDKLIPAGIKVIKNDKKLPLEGMVSLSFDSMDDAITETDTGPELSKSLRIADAKFVEKNSTKNDDRIKILSKFDKISYYKYIDCLFSIYDEINDKRTLISKFLARDACVFGGMLYFALHREAIHLKILPSSNLNRLTYINFLTFRSVDLDCYVNFEVDDEEFGEREFNREGKFIEDNLFKLLKCDTNTIRDFEIIESILKNENIENNNKLLGKNIGFDFKYSKQMGFEYNCQFLAKIGNENDHVFETRISVNGDDMIFVKYDLKSFRKPFIGENILTSICDQIFPNTRAWRLVIYQHDEADQIFSDLSKIFRERPLSYVKFRQGYYRVYVIYVILKEAYRKKYANISMDIIPNNDIFLSKLSFFESRIAKLIIPERIIKTMYGIYSIVKKSPPTERADIKLVIKFIEKCCEMWLWFDSNIC